VVQDWVGDVDFAVAPRRAAPVQVPEDVLGAPGHVGRAARAARAELHAPVASRLHQNDAAGTCAAAGHVTSAVRDQVLRLTVV